MGVVTAIAAGAHSVTDGPAHTQASSEPRDEALETSESQSDTATTTPHQKAPSHAPSDLATDSARAPQPIRTAAQNIRPDGGAAHSQTSSSAAGGSRASAPAPASSAPAGTPGTSQPSQPPSSQPPSSTPSDPSDGSSSSSSGTVVGGVVGGVGGVVGGVVDGVGGIVGGLLG